MTSNPQPKNALARRLEPARGILANDLTRQRTRRTYHKPNLPPRCVGRQFLPTMKTTKAFHFSGPNLAYDLENVHVEPGLRVELDPNTPLKLCEWGLHGSERITDALRYARGLTLSRTKHSGEIVRGDDKMCSRIRVHLDVIDAAKPVVAWAQWCARRAKKHAAAAYATAYATSAATYATTAATSAATNAATNAAAANAERNLQAKVLLAYVKHAGLKL